MIFLLSLYPGIYVEKSASFTYLLERAWFAVALEEKVARYVLREYRWTFKKRTLQLVNFLAAEIKDIDFLEESAAGSRKCTTYGARVYAPYFVGSSGREKVAPSCPVEPGPASEET